MAIKNQQEHSWGIIKRFGKYETTAQYTLDGIRISARLAKGLIYNDIIDWNKIKEIDERALLRTINFSNRSLNELKEICRSKGIEFNGQVLMAHSWRKIESRPKDREVVLYPNDINPTHWIDKPKERK